MKKLFTLSIIALFAMGQNALGWGRLGHDAVAYIAECHLKPKAKKNIERFLDGRSIVYYSSWMDDWRETPAYAHTTVWHSAAVDENLYYTDEVRSPKGDCICELENAIERLKNWRTLDDSTVAVNLRYVIHLTGDMHCPGHVKFPGQKSFNVVFNGKTCSYHSMWDEGILSAAHKWQYLEFAHQLDRLSPKEIRAVSAGTPRDWFHENAVENRVIYEMAYPNQKFSKVEGKWVVNAAHPIAEKQLQRAGYRLARILNELFG